MTFDKMDFSNPSASSSRDEALSSSGSGGFLKTLKRRSEAETELRFRNARQG
jgi:hypothetical protein